MTVFYCIGNSYAIKTLRVGANSREMNNVAMRPRSAQKCARLHTLFIISCLFNRGMIYFKETLGYDYDEFIH